MLQYRSWNLDFYFYTPSTSDRLACAEHAGDGSLSLIILFSYHSLKVLHPLGLKWMDITIWMDALSCSNRKQELSAPIPAAETASWGEHVWFRPHVTVLLQNTQSDLGRARDSCTGLAQESTHHPGAKLHRSPLVLQTARRGPGTGDLVVFLTLLAPPTPACCQPSRNVENGTKGQVRFLPCPAVPRRVRAGWPRGRSHSAAHYCFSMSQYTA